MGNAYLPREQIHAWADDMYENSGSHKNAIRFLVGKQRVLSKYIAANAQPLSVPNNRAVYVFGVIARVFDLAGGKMAAIKMPAIREAEARVGEVAPKLFPTGEGFADRVREIGWRAQPHLIDESLMSLFDEDELDPLEGAKLFLAMWVAIEVLDQHWTPPAGFVGETEYTYVHIEPNPDKESRELDG